LKKQIIHTNDAPAAIGPYSQAVKIDNMVFISGQIPIDPSTGEFTGDDIETQTMQVFQNLSTITKAAGGSLDDIVKLSVYMTDLGQFSVLNGCMERFFKAPYPARAAIEVSALPKGALIEMEAIMAVTNNA